MMRVHCPGAGFRGRGDASRKSASADLSYQRRNHYLKIGARYEVLHAGGSVWFDQVYLGGGSYVHLVTTADGPGSLANRNPSVFIQDVWQATERLSVTAGVRQSHQDIVNLVGSKGNFRVHDGFMPRAGIVYQLGRLGTQRVFASYGRVVQQVALAGQVATQRGHTLITSYPQDPRVDSSGEPRFSSSSATAMVMLWMTTSGQPAWLSGRLGTHGGSVMRSPSPSPGNAVC